MAVPNRTSSVYSHPSLHHQHPPSIAVPEASNSLPQPAERMIWKQPWNHAFASMTLNADVSQSSMYRRSVQRAFGAASHWPVALASQASPALYAHKGQMFGLSNLSPSGKEVTRVLYITCNLVPLLVPSLFSLMYPPPLSKIIY